VVDVDSLFKACDLFFLNFFQASLKPELQRLWLLVVTAKHGAFSLKWFELFKAYGVIHILVFSGSQVAPLRLFMARMFSVFPAFSLWQIVFLRYLFLIALSGLLVFSGFYLEWPEPATRAIIFVLINDLFVRLKDSYKIGATFFLQLLIFPSHLGTLSWCLSWGCWGLSGFLIHRLSSRAFANVLTSAIIWISLCLWFHWDWQLMFLSLPFVAFSNFVLVYLFEKFVFHIGALVWVLGLGHVFWGVFWGGSIDSVARWGQFWGEVMASIIEAISGLLLVALILIGYIREVL
jgi:hypothetical protein